MPADVPRYLPDLSRFVESNLDDATSVLAALTALLADPASYEAAKSQPCTCFTDLLNEFVLKDRALQRHLAEEHRPVVRILIDGKWCTSWRGARESSQSARSFDYDLCISFAGGDRAIAERIATALTSSPTQRRVFYDEFEKNQLWGEELFTYLHKVYAERSLFCLILFSHRYRERAWTRHELRAAQTRMLEERGPYVLPVALDEGAVPKEFSTTGFWPFSPGDESVIADAAEDKINAHVLEHYATIEELNEILHRELSTEAIVDGFKEEIAERRSRGETTSADALSVVAAIAAANTSSVGLQVRGLIDLVLFADGPVGDLFDEHDNVAVCGTASVKRWLGRGTDQGPLMYAAERWSNRIEAKFAEMDAKLDRFREDSGDDAS